MKHLIVATLSLLFASASFASGSIYQTTMDSGGYEASLCQAGLPVSGGLGWLDQTSVASPAVAAASAKLPDHAAPAPTQLVRANNSRG